MSEYLLGFPLISLAAATGYVVGYSSGEDHGIIIALKARCENDAKAWDDRMREMGIEVE